MVKTSSILIVVGVITLAFVLASLPHGNLKSSTDETPEQKEIQTNTDRNDLEIKEKESPPSVNPENTEIQKQELYNFALELVNADRVKFGSSPLKLGNNNAAQEHADDMIKNGYFSHWNSYGEKPYAMYTLSGGQGSMSENIAESSSYCPTITCLPNHFDPLTEIKKHQQSFVYDDEKSNLGHRDAVLGKYHTHVNFGVSYTQDRFVFVQQFEDNVLQISQLNLVDDNIVISGKKSGGLTFDHIAIFEDPEPISLTGNDLENKSPYNLGYYDSGSLVGMIVKRLEENMRYAECESGLLSVSGSDGQQCVEYSYYDISGDADFTIKVDVSKWIDKNGLQTMHLYLNNPQTGEQIEVISLTIDYLNIINLSYTKSHVNLEKAESDSETSLEQKINSYVENDEIRKELGKLWLYQEFGTVKADLTYYPNQYQKKVESVYVYNPKGDTDKIIVLNKYDEVFYDSDTQLYPDYALPRRIEVDSWPKDEYKIFSIYENKINGIYKFVLED